MIGQPQDSTILLDLQCWWFAPLNPIAAHVHSVRSNTMSYLHLCMLVVLMAVASRGQRPASLDSPKGQQDLLAAWRNDIFTFWSKHGPDAQGGFHGTLDRIGTPIAPTTKSLVQQVMVPSIQVLLVGLDCYVLQHCSDSVCCERRAHGQQCDLWHLGLEAGNNKQTLYPASTLNQLVLTALPVCRRATCGRSARCTSAAVCRVQPSRACPLPRTLQTSSTASSRSRH